MARKKKTEESESVETEQQEEAHDHDHEHDHDHDHGEDNKAAEAALEEKKKKLSGKKVEPGAILKLDLYAKTVGEEHNVTFMASNSEDAKELPNYDEKGHYHPDYYIVGEQIDLPFKVKEKVDASNYFDEFEMELEAVDAYGERKGDLVQMMNAKKVEKELGKEIRPGMQYTDKQNNRTGTIIRNNQGRCMVDFNHPLVDRKCKFRVKILDAYVEESEKIEGIMAKNGLPKMEYTVNPETKDMEIIIPDQLKFNQSWMQQGWQIKFMLSMELQRHAGLNDVKFAEVYKNFTKKPEDVAEDAKSEEKEEEKKE